MTSSPQIPPSSNELSNPMQSLPAHAAYATPAPIWLEGGGGDDDSVDLTSILHSLRRKWLVAALVGSVLATLLAAVLYIMIPEESEAVALLRVSMKDANLLNSRFSQADEREYAVFKQTQAALISSPYVLNAAMRDPDMQSLNVIKSEEKPLALLEEMLTVAYAGKSEILRVSMAAQNGNEAIKLVDSVVGAYMDEIASADRVDKAERLEILRSQQRQNAREIQEMTGDIEKLSTSIGTSDSDLAKLNQQIERSELDGIERERERLLQRLQTIEGNIFVAQAAQQARSVTPSQYDIEDQLESDRQYNEAKRTVVEYQRQLAVYAGSTRRSTPEMVQVETEIASLQDVMHRRERELMPRIKHRIQRKYVDENQEMADFNELQAIYQVTKGNIERVEARYEEQIQKVRDLTGFSAELVTKRSALNNLQKSTDDIVREISRLELNMKKPPRVQLVQKATIPDMSSRKAKLMQVVAAWLASFMLSIAIVTGIDFLAKKLNSGRDIEKKTNMPVIGSLPSLRSGVLRSANESAVVDSVDSIRAAITYGAQGKPINSVVITSALGGEGKSTLASQLAVSLARGGRRTLLIDGDVRNPQQHLVFGMPLDRGLCDVLRGSSQLEEVVQATPAENLWILPAGRCDSAAFQALGGQSISSAMERLTSQFDFVVIDSGPVLTGPESLIYGQHVDGAVMSTRRDVSRTGKIDEANRRLQSVGIHVVGAVIHGTTADSRSGLAALPA